MNKTVLLSLEAVPYLLLQSFLRTFLRIRKIGVNMTTIRKILIIIRAEVERFSGLRALSACL